jgi:hypothetical protein
MYTDDRPLRLAIHGRLMILNFFYSVHEIPVGYLKIPGGTFGCCTSIRRVGERGHLLLEEWLFRFFLSQKRRTTQSPS